MTELSTTEKYMLAEILVCGALTVDEYVNSSDINTGYQRAKIDELHNKNILVEETLLR